MPDIVERVYAYIADHQGRFSALRCASEMDIPVDDVKRALVSLQETGRIKKSGQAGGAATLDQLLKEKKLLKAELKNLSSQQASGKLTWQQYEKNSALLKKKIERLDRKMAALRKQKTLQKPVPTGDVVRPERVASLIEERDTISGWIENLNIGRDSVSEASFNKLMEEYRSRLESVKTAIAESVGKLLTLWEDHKALLESLTSDLEDLTARTVSGEIEAKDSALQKHELEGKIERVSEEINLIESVLSKTGT